METRTILLRPQCQGKVPRRYGKNAYIFPMGDGEMLKRNGWTLLGGGQKGNYFSPPAGKSGGEALVVAVVPTQDEIERMAMEWHKEDVTRTPSEPKPDTRRRSALLQIAERH